MVSKGKMGNSKKTEEREVLSFEQGIARLEQIVGELEQNNIPLEQALAYFQEGVEMVKHCNSLLDTAEIKVKTLLEANQGLIGDV